MDRPIGLRTISVEVRPQRGRIIITTSTVIVKDATGSFATFDINDLASLAAAIVGDWYSPRRAS
jgi:hypothetical protein